MKKQHSKQAKAEEVEINYKMFANPVFINPGRYVVVQFHPSFQFYFPLF